MKFNKRLEETLMWKGITQKEFAEMLGIGRTTVCMWIQGTNKPNLEMFYRICIILKESADYMLGLEN